MASDAVGSADCQGRRSRDWRRWRHGLLAGGLSVAVAAAGATDLPKPGRHVGSMCVHPITSTVDAKNCGSVDIWLLRNDLAVVRISDIAYQIALHPDALDVVMMHGAMQIDAFTTVYRWEGTRLRFDDRDKGMRYQIDLAPPSPVAR